MRYTDEELYEMEKDDLDEIKLHMPYDTANRIFISRLKDLIKESTRKKDWMDPGVKHLRNYREKAVDFLMAKLVR